MATATKEAPAEVTLDESVAQKKEDKTLPPLDVGNRGVELSNFEEMWRFAKALAASDLAPKDYRGKPDNALIAIQLGLEVGLPPMSAIQNIAVINGRPTIWGDAMLAVCQRSPVFDHASFREEFEGKDDKDDAFAAVCYVSRIGRVEPIVSRFSVGDAKRAGLWSKQGPWTQYPHRMLKMRARAFALRDAFADVLKGLYATEELSAESVLSGIDTTSTGDDLRAQLTAAADPPAVAPAATPEPKPKPPKKKPKPDKPADPEPDSIEGDAPSLSELRSAIAGKCNQVGQDAANILQGCGIKSRLAVGECDDINILMAADAALLDVLVQREADAEAGLPAGS